MLQYIGTLRGQEWYLAERSLEAKWETESGFQTPPKYWIDKPVSSLPAPDSSADSSRSGRASSESFGKAQVHDPVPSP